MERRIAFRYMKAKSVVQKVAGAVVVYVVVAACGAAGSSPTGTVDPTVRDGSDVFDGVVDAIVDGVVDPVGEANAGPVPPEVVTEPCNKTYACGSLTCRYAEHAFPGKTAEDLAASVVGVGDLDTSAHRPPGYSRQGAVALFLRDGSAAAGCGVDTAPSYIAVTFIHQP